MGMVLGKKCGMKVIGMPGKHVPPGVLGDLNDLLKAVFPLPLHLDSNLNLKLNLAGYQDQ